MPSMLHEALIDLFRNRSELAAEILIGSLGVTLPDFGKATETSVDFTQIIPTEYRADLVILLETDRPVQAIVIEVQLSKDADKRSSWPVYLTTLGARYKCPACLLVVCPDADIARYCSRPIPTGHKGFDLTPYVLGPSSIPVVTDEGVARDFPEISMLSVLAHGKGDQGEAIARAALAGILTLDDLRALFYTELVLQRVTDPVRLALEELMKPEAFEIRNEYLRKSYSAGLIDGEAKGKVDGKAEGKAEGKASGIVAFLEARGIDVSDDLREMILACRDLDQLDRWIKRAVTATSAQELFE